MNNQTSEGTKVAAAQLSRVIFCLVWRPNNVAHGCPLLRHFHSEPCPMDHRLGGSVWGRLLRFAGLPLDNKVRANQFPRSVSRAKPFRCFMVTVSIPSRARSAVVIPAIGLPPSAPCQAPSFLLSPPALKQATNALFLLGDSSTTGACRSPAARTDAEGEQIGSAGKAGSTALSLRRVMSAPLDMTKASLAAA
jgi:hypothetical protein